MVTAAQGQLEECVVTKRAFVQLPFEDPISHLVKRPFQMPSSMQRILLGARECQVVRLPMITSPPDFAEQASLLAATPG